MKETGRNITLPRIVIGLIVIVSVESLGQGVVRNILGLINDIPLV